MAEEELVDHIDEEDNVIGQITRKEAHDNFLMHRAVHIVIETSDKRILLHQVKRTKRICQLQMGNSAAGHVKAGCSYEDAARIELMEELGINPPLELITKFRQHVPGKENEICALYKGTSDGPFTNWEAEAENINFFTREELDHLTRVQPQVFTPGMLLVYKILREREGGS